MCLQPSTFPYLFDLQQVCHTTSTFNPLIPFRPSTILPCLFRPPILPHPFDLSHTHTISGTLAGCHTVQKDEDIAWGLAGSTPNRAWQTRSCCSQPIEFWCRRTDALRSGPTSSPCVVEPSLHVVGAGGQTLFAAGLPTFRMMQS